MIEKIKLPQVEIPEKGLYDVFVELVLNPCGLGKEDVSKEEKTFDQIWK